MAHYLMYKRPLEVVSFEFNFEELLPEVDVILDVDKTSVVVFDSAGVDQTKYFITPPLVFSNLVVTVNMATGLDGEDYEVHCFGVGNITLGKPTPNRILEMRVRKHLAGNL